MRLEFTAYIFLLLLGFLVIGTVLFSNEPWYNNLWYAANWLTLILAGVYFATNTKNKWLMWALSALVGWVFSAFCFEIILICKPELIVSIDRPSANFIWYLMAFMITLTIITLRHGKTTNRGNSEDH